MTGPLLVQPLAAKLRAEQQAMRAHDVLASREQQRKHAERLRARADRFAARLKARLQRKGACI